MKGVLCQKRGNIKKKREEKEEEIKHLKERKKDLEKEGVEEKWKEKDPHM